MPATVGAEENVTYEHSGVAAETTDGIVTVAPVSDRIVHVRVGPVGYTRNYNPAVIATQRPVKFTVSEASDAVG